MFCSTLNTHTLVERWVQASQEKYLGYLIMRNEMFLR